MSRNKDLCGENTGKTSNSNQGELIKWDFTTNVVLNCIRRFSTYGRHSASLGETPELALQASAAF